MNAALAFGRRDCCSTYSCILSPCRSFAQFIPESQYGGGGNATSAGAITCSSDTRRHSGSGKKLRGVCSVLRRSKWWRQNDNRKQTLLEPEQRSATLYIKWVVYFHDITFYSKSKWWTEVWFSWCGYGELKTHQISFLFLVLFKRQLQEGELNIKCDRVQHVLSLCSDVNPSQQRGNNSYTNTPWSHEQHGVRPC